MNNTNNPDEVLSNEQIAALESKLSIITDVSRSDSDAAQLTESELIQAQTFDKLINLANAGITLKPVVFAKPSSAAPAPSRKAIFRKGLIALSAAVVVALSAVMIQYAISTRSVNLAPGSDTTAAASFDSLNSLNYWNDSFDNQLSEFEGEMICLSANYDNLDVVENMYLEDFSEGGDF